MGLSGPKARRKLNKDPNNTKWSRDTNTFGQRMLRAQGWEPGQYLGKKDAPHAEWHTEANSSHIRVALKDDNLGLGAKQNNSNECTGLDVFKDLLGRLNGKSETLIESERKKRDEAKRNLYTERKFGSMRFVRGGWLVDDQMKEETSKDTSGDNDKDQEQETVVGVASPAGSISEAKEESQPAKKSKKRKHEGGDDADEQSIKKRQKKERKEKKRKKRKSKADGIELSAKEAVPIDLSAEEPAEDSTPKERKSKKVKRKDGESRSKDSSGKKDKPSKKKRKNRDINEESTSVETGSAAESPTATKATTLESTPMTSGTSTPQPQTSSRHHARKRYIDQKKRALMDQESLKQIFMIKA